jgi:hypothetical protein
MPESSGGKIRGEMNGGGCVVNGWTPLRDRQFVTCDICPYCKPQGTREQGWPGAGYKYGICDHGGNLVFMEPWEEKKIHGSGYISHKVGGCGLYEMDQLPEITAEVEKANKRREERQ